MMSWYIARTTSSISTTYPLFYWFCMIIPFMLIILSEFVVPLVHYLGHIISVVGVQPDIRLKPFQIGLSLITIQVYVGFQASQDFIGDLFTIMLFLRSLSLIYYKARLQKLIGQQQLKNYKQQLPLPQFWPCQISHCPLILRQMFPPLLLAPSFLTLVIPWLFSARS